MGSRLWPLVALCMAMVLKINMVGDRDAWPPERVIECLRSHFGSTFRSTAKQNEASTAGRQDGRLVL